MMVQDELIKQCIAGEPKAQERLYILFSRQMMGVCMRYAGSKDEAEDMLQDGFIKLFEKIGDYRAEGSFEGWVRKIFVNTALDYCRKQKQARLADDVEDVQHLLLAPENIQSNINAEELMKALQQLPTGYRTVFNLFAIEGYSHKEIAEQLNITESTSKSQFMRARNFLKEMLQTQNLI